MYSDACRSIPKEWRSALLTPGTVFRVMDPRDPPPEVDTFYATLPGNPAFEVPPGQASQSYRGLLTDCLMKALEGQVATVIEDESSRRVVPARPLKIYLAKAIPAAAANVSITLTQSPDARVESALPKYLSELAGGVDQVHSVKPPRDLGALEAVRATDLPLGLKRRHKRRHHRSPHRARAQLLLISLPQPHRSLGTAARHRRPRHRRRLGRHAARSVPQP